MYVPFINIVSKVYLCDGNRFVSFYSISCDECRSSGFSQMNWTWANMHFLSQNGKGRIPAESNKQNQHDQHRRKMSERIIKNTWLRCASVLYIVICYVRVHSQWNKWAVLLCVRRPLTPTHAYIHTLFICINWLWQIFGFSSSTTFSASL